MVDDDPTVDGCVQVLMDVAGETVDELGVDEKFTAITDIVGLHINSLRKLKEW